MGGTKVNAPQPTAEETALQKEQLSLLQKQSAETEAFKPILYESMGLREVNGNLEKIPWEERLAKMDPMEKSQYDLAQSYLGLQNQALEGKIPVSPAMEAELTQQKSDLESNLSRRLGSKWSLSTSGIQSMDQFNKRADLLREEARRGQISTGEGLIGARMGLLGNQQAQQYQQGQNWGLPAFNSLNSGYSNAYQPYQFNRQMEYNAKSQTAANRMGLISGAMQLAGVAGGAAIGKYCWVAEVLFGVNSEKTHNARRYANTVDNWFTRLYGKHGRKWAKWIEAHPWSKPFVRPIWEWMAYQGKNMMEVEYADTLS